MLGVCCGLLGSCSHRGQAARYWQPNNAIQSITAMRGRLSVTSARHRFVGCMPLMAILPSFAGGAVGTGSLEIGTPRNAMPTLHVPSSLPSLFRGRPKLHSESRMPFRSSQSIKGSRNSTVDLEYHCNDLKADADLCCDAGIPRAFRVQGLTKGQSLGPNYMRNGQRRQVLS